MKLNIDRSMVVQAVLEGQIGSEYVTVDEMIEAHHLLADATLGQLMLEESQRSDVTVFNRSWYQRIPN